MVSIMTVASLAVDLGYWRYQQRLQQTAADSAALAGTVQLNYTTNGATSITTAAQADAATNGFANGGSVTVTVNNPPLSGGYSGNNQAVEVIIAKAQPAFFAAVIGKSATTSARAVAMLSTVTRNCMYALNQTDNSAVTIDGGTLNMPKCGIISNGGLLFNGGTIDAASIGYNSSEGVTDGSTTFTGASPKVAVPATDPCPTVSGCAYLAANPPATSPCISQTTFTAPTTMQPGTYCGGQVTVNGSGTLNFAAGTYDFENGFTDNSATAMTGTGVTFYVPSGSFIVNSNVNVSLTAPTTGNDAGVLVYMPSSNTSGLTINGGSGGGWAGMMYLPGGNLIVDGGLSSWVLTVANQITFNGSPSISIPTAALPGFNGHAVLAE